MHAVLRPSPHHRSPTSRTANIGAPGPPGLTDALHHLATRTRRAREEAQAERVRRGRRGGHRRPPPRRPGSALSGNATGQGSQPGQGVWQRAVWSLRITSIMARATAAANGQSHPSCEGDACGDGHVRGQPERTRPVRAETKRCLPCSMICSRPKLVEPCFGRAAPAGRLSFFSRGVDGELRPRGRERATDRGSGMESHSNPLGMPDAGWYVEGGAALR